MIQQILRELATELSYPFCSLFNQSLQMGTFPDSWKLSNVCPMPKKAFVHLYPIFALCLLYARLQKSLNK